MGGDYSKLIGTKGVEQLNAIWGVEIALKTFEGQLEEFDYGLNMKLCYGIIVNPFLKYDNIIMII